MPTNNTIVLIGFRGAGKTTIAARLAERLALRYVSTDQLAEQQCGMSIQQFVAEHGWQDFRAIEHTVVQQLQHTRNAVVDCGGGVVEHRDSMAVLQLLGLVVWVDASASDMAMRVLHDDSRPLLSEQSVQHDVAVNYERRRHLYAHYADAYINTSEFSAEECVAHIETQWHKRTQ